MIIQPREQRRTLTAKNSVLRIQKTVTANKLLVMEKKPSNANLKKVKLNVVFSWLASISGLTCFLLPKF